MKKASKREARKFSNLYKQRMTREMPSNSKKILTIEKLQNNKHFEHHEI